MKCMPDGFWLLKETGGESTDWDIRGLSLVERHPKYRRAAVSEVTGRRLGAVWRLAL